MFSANSFLLLMAVGAAVHAATDPFEKHTISAPGINASFIGYGARLTNLLVNDRDGNPQDVVLGYDNGTQYAEDTATYHTYFGPVVGRYANRIKNGTFTVDGITSNISENEHGGLDTLHGGKVGYDQRNWTISALTNDSITFMLADEAYEGFPGTVITYATYTVTESSWTSRLVSIPLDKPTPIMLANHVYWSLNAFTDTSKPTVLNDTLWMPYSDRYILVDNILIPNGSLGVVAANPPLDFTLPKEIGADIESAHACGWNCTGYDNAFIVDRPRYSGPESTDLTLLSLWSNTTGIRMDLTTNQRSLQIYACNNMNGTIAVKESQQHGDNTTYVEKYGCIVIETQQWIDGVNHPEWGQEEYAVYSTETEPAIVWAKYDFGTIQ
ncbi:MAG: hypothetical protein M1834_007166 [Cirrosporium novae-zelandiae]|nr:MAG: hypothetical protein M1834_007166 [Cirrosporium novae-zelandiae]